MIEFPFKKFLKRFNPEDYEDDKDKTEEAAWDYGKQARESLMMTGLIEFFGIAVRAARGTRNTWDVWLESWDNITGRINVGDKIKDKRTQHIIFRRKSEEDK